MTHQLLFVLPFWASLLLLLIVVPVASFFIVITLLKILRIESDYLGCLVIILGLFIFGGLAKFLSGQGYISGEGPNAPPKEIIINGKIADKVNNKPLNNRLVILYLNGVEIARDTTRFKELLFEKDGPEPSDGLFSFSFENKYKVTLDKLELTVKSGQTKSHPNNQFQQGLVIFNSVYEDQKVSVQIPSKGVDYQIKIIPGEIETLPVEFAQPIKTYLLADNRISFKKPQSPSGSNPITNIRYDTHRDSVILDTFKEVLNNCAGSGRATKSYRKTRTYVHQVEATVNAEVGGSLPIPQFFNISLSAKLQGHYGFREGETSEEELKYNFIAEPHTNQEYTITLKEMWESGSAFVRQTNGSTLEIPFRVKTALVYEINSTSDGCGY